MKSANETSDSGVSMSIDLTKSNLDDTTCCCRNSLLENTFLDSSMSDDSDCKRKANRFFTSNSIEVLKRWFDLNSEYPYPDETTTGLLANEANISTKQVRKWFANKRVRSNKCYKQIYRTKKKTESDNIQKDTSCDNGKPIHQSTPNIDDFKEEDAYEETDVQSTATLNYNQDFILNYWKQAVLIANQIQSRQAWQQTPIKDEQNHAPKKTRINFGNIDDLIY